MAKSQDVINTELQKDLQYLKKNSDEQKSTLSSLVGEVRGMVGNFTAEINKIKEIWFTVNEKAKDNQKDIALIQKDVENLKKEADITKEFRTTIQANLKFIRWLLGVIAIFGPVFNAILLKLLGLV